MIHIYSGDGKGKTTAGVGLCIRAAGAGKKVVIYQFLKDNHSSERQILAKIPEIHLIPGPDRMKFTNQMTDEEKRALSARYKNVLDDLEQQLSKDRSYADVVFLDELLYAVKKDFVDETQILQLISHFPDAEWIFTGRGEAGALWDKADYISIIRKERHPLDSGIGARKGIEY